MQLFNVTGICLSFFVNYGINIQIKTLSSAKWRIPFALQMLPGVLLLAGIVFQNESPRWLVEKNRLRDAAKALAQVRGKTVDDKDVVQELDEIITDFQGNERMPLIAQLRAACSSNRMFYQASFGVILMFWQQWTGTESCQALKGYKFTVCRDQLDQLLRTSNLPEGWAERHVRRAFCHRGLWHSQNCNDGNRVDGFHGTNGPQGMCCLTRPNLHGYPRFACTASPTASPLSRPTGTRQLTMNGSGRSSSALQVKRLRCFTLASIRPSIR